MDRDALGKWISDNKNVVTYMVREAAFFSVSCCSPAEDFMNETYEKKNKQSFVFYRPPRFFSLTRFFPPASGTTGPP